MTTIIRGENRIINRPLKQADGVTAYPAANFTSVVCELVQRGRVIRIITRGATDLLLRNGADETSLDLELTSAITALLEPGALTERYTCEMVSATFQAEPGKAIFKFEKEEIEIA